MANLLNLVALLSTPEPFRIWLSSQGEDCVIGRQHLSNDCPIKQFLNACGERCLVGNQFNVSRITLYEDDSRKERIGHIQTPIWVEAFSQALDEDSAPEEAFRKAKLQNENWTEERFENYHRDIQGAYNVTAKMALDILEHVTTDASYQAEMELMAQR